MAPKSDHLPSNVMYVPQDMLDDLSRKVFSDGTAIRRNDVLQLLAETAAADTIMVPIYVDPMECAKQFCAIEFYPIAVELQEWRWLVKRLLRETNKWGVARMIANARQTYLLAPGGEARAAS